MAAVRQFEQSTRFKPLKKFHRQQAADFKTYLGKQKNQRSKKRQVFSTVDAILRLVKALFAFFMLTGARDGAVASLKLRHVNVELGHVFQDAREVNAKGANTIMCQFFPVDAAYRTCFVEWVRFMKEDRLYGPEDALFPKAEMGYVAGQGLCNMGLAREGYASASKLNEIIKGAFANVQLPKFTPHAFRKTLTKYGDEICTSMEQRKAWSMNYGHANLGVTINSYLPVTPERQMELIVTFGTLEKQHKVLQWIQQLKPHIRSQEQ